MVQVSRRLEGGRGVDRYEMITMSELYEALCQTIRLVCYMSWSWSHLSPLLSGPAIAMCSGVLAGLRWSGDRRLDRKRLGPGTCAGARMFRGIRSHSWPLFDLRPASSKPRLPPRLLFSCCLYVIRPAVSTAHRCSPLLLCEYFAPSLELLPVKGFQFATATYPPTLSVQPLPTSLEDPLIRNSAPVI